MVRRLLSRFRRFRRDEEGTVIAEVVIMFPTLFAAVIAMFVFFDAFRNQAINLKAAYTISDALSRETDMITNTYMVNLWRMHRFLTNSRTLTKMRVSVIQFDGDDGEYSVVWSENKGGAGAMNDAELQNMVNDDQIPVMPDGEVLIMVQSRASLWGWRRSRSRTPSSPAHALPPNRSATAKPGPLMDAFARSDPRRFLDHHWWRGFRLGY